jgi:rhamnose utilization protein RhaD (predicted bifunctional aldolase and dehydrogenase)
MRTWDESEVAELCSRHPELDPDRVRRAWSAGLLAAQPDLGAAGMCSASLKCVGEGGLELLMPGAGEAPEPERFRADSGHPDAALHRAVPARFVDQTYPSAVVALACQPDAELRVRALLGARVGWLARHESLPAAARALADLCDKHPELEGVVLQGRGLLSFGDDARESFERALLTANRAEAAVQERMEGGRILDARPVVAMRDACEVAHVLRGALAAPTGELDRPFVHVLLEYRSSDEIAHFASAPITPLLAAAMPPTDAHARLTGGSTLFVASPPYADLRRFGELLRREIEAYRRAWIASAERCVSDLDLALVGPLDPTPRAVLLPGLGLFGVGRNRAEARASADAAAHAIRVKIRSVALGQYEGLPERAALQASGSRLPLAERALAGNAALVVGATDCGAALVRALSGAGAEILLADRDAEALEARAAELGVEHAIADATDALDVRDALRSATERFGGLDVFAVDADSLAGNAGEIVAQAIAFLAAQGTGGAIALVARDSDVTELCRNAAREAAPARVYVNAVVLGPAEPVDRRRAPVTWQQAARAALFLAERGVPMHGQLLRIDGEI